MENSCQITGFKSHRKILVILAQAAELLGSAGCIEEAVDWQVCLQNQNQECAEVRACSKCGEADRQRLHQNLPGGGLLLLGHMHSFKRFCGVKPMPTTVNVLGKSWGLNVQGFCCRFLGYSLEPPKSSPGYDTCPLHLYKPKPTCQNPHSCNFLSERCI